MRVSVIEEGLAKEVVIREGLEGGAVCMGVRRMGKDPGVAAYGSLCPHRSGWLE
jgi:hypothetical protein